jgi:S1-C subfamily serine protease
MAKLAFLLILVAPVCCAQSPNRVPKSPTAAEGNQHPALTTAEVAKKVSPSVVVIEGKTESGDVLGSGFIVSKDGKIVTNLHVIRDMKTATVQLATGQIVDAISVLATDEVHDLAIVKVAGSDYAALELGNSDALTLGEPVVIVGSPRGLEGTVTAGILSSVRDLGDGVKVLQTDAAVNPGNSGGPLLNSKGQVIGVVSFQLRSAQGLNFAIPINYVRELLNHLHGPLTLETMRKSMSGADGITSHRSDPSSEILFGGVQLKLGMVEDAVLAQFASSIFRLPDANESYMVTAKTEGVSHSVGSLTFNAGKLSRIEVDNYYADGNDAVALAKAVYTAIAAGEKAGGVDIWTAHNEDANSPMYEVHLIFKDREVEISTTKFQGKEWTSVQSYYPRILKAGKEADSKQVK